MGASRWHLPASPECLSHHTLGWEVGEDKEAGEKILPGLLLRDSGEPGALNDGAEKELQV